MATSKDEVVDWLHDAHSMERGLEVALKKHAENDEMHPAVRERVQIHLDETRRHAERIEQCLERLGTSSSTLKTATAQAMQMGQGLMTKFARDERVKDYLSDYGAEYFEVACYKSLIAGARVAGTTEIIPLLEENSVKIRRWRNGST